MEAAGRQREADENLRKFQENVGVNLAVLEAFSGCRCGIGRENVFHCGDGEGERERSIQIITVNYTVISI